MAIEVYMYTYIYTVRIYMHISISIPKSTYMHISEPECHAPP